jgi:hypothetical protein
MASASTVTGTRGLALLAHVVAARQQPKAALALLRRVVSAPVLKGVRGEAGEVVSSLIEWLGKTEEG